MRKSFNRYDRYISKLNTCFDTIAKIESDMETEIEELSNVDKELSDYMHIIENDSDNIKNPKQFIQNIAQLRKRRREIKIIMAVANRYKQLSNRMVNADNRTMLISELHKEVKNQQQEYKFRVLEKEDIVDESIH